MTILLWWTLASVAVSLFFGAFLSYGHRDDETLGLDRDLESEATRLPAARETEPHLT